MSYYNDNNQSTPQKKAYGGYRNLESYKTSTIIYDMAVMFCERYIDRRSRTHDQITQAARSGRQNIAEGSMAAVTSKKTELKLTGVARASLEEVLLDCEDFLRQRGLRQWDKDDPEAKKVQALGYKSDRSYKTYESYMSDPEQAANCLICLIHQANYLLDQQLKKLKADFIENGGFTEQLFKERMERRKVGG